MAAVHAAAQREAKQAEENGRRMKITCQACQAKYTIADEKVVGKTVKIRCKKCGATIMLNAGESGAGASQPAGAAFDYAKVAQEPWTVNVDDGDQRTMTEQELVAAYRSGVVNDETFCWKEGMGDWLPLADIAPLREACAAAAGALPRVGEQDDEAATRVAEVGAGPGAGAAASAMRPGATARAKEGGKDGNGATAAVAARRAGGRAPDHDLFGAAAKAGGEDEVMTSAPAGEKLTGARNENSVLFALNPLGDKAAAAAAPAKMTATNEASGLIDIRQLSAQMRSSPAEEKKKSRVDDIMNLGGGAAFSPNLAAPVLAAPSLEHISTPPPPAMLGEGGGLWAKNKALLVLALGAGALFVAAIAALGVVLLLVRGRVPGVADDRDRPAAVASAAEATSKPGASASAGASAAAGAQAAASPSESASSAPSEPAGATTAKEAPKEPAAKETAAKESAPAAPAAKPAAAPAPVKEPTPALPVAAPAAEFNMGEARARLASISGNVQSCKRGDTTGSGRVEIVFAPSGSVQSASVMPGSPFDGSVTAKCVEARFRGARVPPFGGGPFTVTKSFSIN